MGFPSKDDVTPLRKQYLKLKGEYPNHLVLFELGDFYEAFDADAQTLAEDLDLTVTQRPTNRHTRVPMAGFPKRFLDENVKKLLAKGRAVAVAQQIGEPSAKGLMERQVTQVYPEPKALKDPQPRWKSGDWVETPSKGKGKVMGYGSENKVLVMVLGEIVTVPETELVVAIAPEQPQDAPKTAESVEDPKDAQIAELQAKIADLDVEAKSYAKLWAEAEIRYDKALLEIDALKSPTKRIEVKFYSGAGIGNSEKRARLEAEVAAIRNEGWSTVYETVVSDQNGSYYYARFERVVGVPSGDDQTEKVEEKRLVQPVGPVMTLVVPPAPEQSFSESVREGSATPAELRMIGDAEIARARAIPVIETMENIIGRGFTPVPEGEKE